MLRISGDNMKNTLANIENVWKERIPERPFTYNFLDDAYNKLYVSDKHISALFGIAAGLAIILACLGLFGLAAFTTLQRTKEIGIRRVLGATVSSITLLIAKNFLQLVGISILVAVPVAWWAGNKWLQNFAFRIPIHWYVFAGTAFVTVLISLFTVGYHSVKVSLANPVESLRSE
jgi:putative ABC transport system permease protein